MERKGRRIEYRGRRAGCRSLAERFSDIGAGGEKYPAGVFYVFKSEPGIKNVKKRTIIFLNCTKNILYTTKIS